MKKCIPNLVTCLNVISGTLSVFMAIYGQLEWAAGLILLAMVFDFFDGFSARLLHVKSEMGKELDSLADMVSFGLAPSLLAHFLMLRSLPGQSAVHFAEWSAGMKFMLFCPLVMPAFSAWRLARFNLDVRQTLSFIGMPTPANALFWVCLVFGSVYSPGVYDFLFGNVYVLGGVALLLSVLLVCGLPMFSLKIQNFSWKGNGFRYGYLICLILLACIWGKDLLMFVIPLYLLFAVAEALFRFSCRSRSSAGS